VVQPQAGQLMCYCNLFVLINTRSSRGHVHEPPAQAGSMLTMLLQLLMVCDLMPVNDPSVLAQVPSVLQCTAGTRRL
jgi:hypothetical protein